MSPAQPFHRSNSLVPWRIECSRYHEKATHEPSGRPCWISDRFGGHHLILHAVRTRALPWGTLNQTSRFRGVHEAIVGGHRRHSSLGFHVGPGVEETIYLQVQLIITSEAEESIDQSPVHEESTRHTQTDGSIRIYMAIP
jgi:hypothetical protein